nr:5853_t:CDS:2 [Entrophospora candida]
MEGILRFPMPKTWKDMFKAHETVIGLLKYELLLLESSKSINDFLWSESDNQVTTMTTRMIYTPDNNGTKKIQRE